MTDPITSAKQVLWVSIGQFASGLVDERVVEENINRLIKAARPTTTFVVDGVRFYAFSKLGAFFGSTGDALLYVPMLEDGTPVLRDGKPEVGEVTNFDGRQEELDTVNDLLGTSFDMPQFPGR